MANKYLSISIDISDIPLSEIQVGNCTLVSIEQIIPPVYNFTFRLGIALVMGDILDLSQFQLACIAGQQLGRNSIAVVSSDFINTLTMCYGIIVKGGSNMTRSLYWKRLRIMEWK